MPLSRTTIRRRTRSLSTICCTARRTASTGRACGSIWPATPTALATPTIRREPSGPTAIGSSRPFNDNKPFDQFTIEQLPATCCPTRPTSNSIATAFHRNTLTNSEGGTQDEEFRNSAVVDRVNTTMAVWMGTTIACAQCHTHKFDPISQQEYFQFFAILNNTEDADRRDESPVLPIYTDAARRQATDLQACVPLLQAILATPD